MKRILLPISVLCLVGSLLVPSDMTIRDLVSAPSASSAVAAEPSAAVATPIAPTAIVGPDQVQAGHPAWFRIEAPEGFSVTWFPSDELQTGLPHIQPGSALFWSDTPGRYRINGLQVDWDNRQIVPLTKTVEVIGEGPEPEPDPEPDPPPDTKYQVVIFLESDDRESLPDGQQEIVASLKLRKELENRGHKLLGIYDDDSTGPDGIPSRVKPWFDAIKGDRMPRIAIAPIAGGDVRDFPLPEDKAALWKLLTEGKP